jgi:hypothetical protein
MNKWYVSVALLAAWLGQAGTATAQSIPTPYGAARIPTSEPIPCGQTPNLVPGPISPLGAPPGPPPGYDYPADHTSAFQCEEYVRDEHCFFNFGVVGMMRQKLGTGPIAFQDPQNLDTGVFPQGSQPTLTTLNDLSSRYDWGPKATIGYLWQNESIEFTGFWIPKTGSTFDTVMPGRVDLFFFNPPVGFEGNNGLWLQADRVTTRFNYEVYNGEINYRYTNAGVLESELILGVRYLQLQEQLGIFTDDDGISLPGPGGVPDPTRQATYMVRAQNQIIAPQIGFECSCALVPGLVFGINGKAAVGANLVTLQNSLTRGDGFVGFNSQRHETVAPGQIYEAGAFLDISLIPTDRLHVRLGYNAMFLVNVATAEDQVNFNLANPVGNTSTHGNVFFHGPMAELQFLF